MDQDVTEQKEQQKEKWETPTAGLKDKMEGLGQTMHVGRNEEQRRMHRVDNMDTESNSHERKTGNFEEGGLGGGFGLG